ncbi:unnamed protein product, partial [Mesorhabditis spiculigera]
MLAASVAVLWQSSNFQAPISSREWLFHIHAQRLIFRIKVFTERTLLLSYGYPYDTADDMPWIPRYYELPAALTDVRLEDMEQIRCEGHIADTDIRQKGIFAH